MTTKFDPTKPVQTRHGLKARIICTDRVCVQPIVALITDSKGNEQISSFNTSGAFWPNETQAANDLINIPEPKKLRPWKPEEVPVGAKLRLATNNPERTFEILGCIESFGRIKEPAIILDVIDGVYYPRGYVFNADAVSSLSKYEHSTDGGKTWLPCGVEE